MNQTDKYGNRLRRIEKLLEFEDRSLNIFFWLMALMTIPVFAYLYSLSLSLLIWLVYKIFRKICKKLPELTAQIIFRPSGESHFRFFLRLPFFSWLWTWFTLFSAVSVWSMSWQKEVHRIRQISWSISYILMHLWTIKPVWHPPNRSYFFWWLSS